MADEKDKNQDELLDIEPTPEEPTDDFRGNTGGFELAENTPPAQQDVMSADSPVTNLLAHQDPVAMPQEAPQMAEAPPRAQAPVSQQSQALQPAQQPAANGTQTPYGVNPLAPIDAQELKAEDAGVQNDLVKGYIKPKTYQDLFAKKDTLGKIGTMFGLLVSGAGSGLSNQPNAVLEMMNKEIERDLDAQKNSAANAQNFVRMNQAQYMNQKNVELMKKQGLMTDAQAKLAEAEARTKADTLAHMQMNRAAFHKLVQTMEKLPEGSPQRAQMQQYIGMMSGEIDAMNASLADRAAAKSALARSVFDQSGGGIAGADTHEGSFQKEQDYLRLNGLTPLAENRAARHIGGIPGLASVPLSGADRENITSGTQFQNQLQGYIDWVKKHAGSVMPEVVKEGTARAAELQAAYRQATNGGVFKEGEQNFIARLIDDNPTKFFQQTGLRPVIPQLEAIKEESKAKLDSRLKALGFPGAPPVSPTWVDKGSPKAKAEPAGIVRSTSSGRSFVSDGKGGWQLVKDNTGLATK